MTLVRTGVVHRTKSTRSAREVVRRPPGGRRRQARRPPRGPIESGAMCSNLQMMNCGGSRSCSGAGWRSEPRSIAAKGRRRGRPTSSGRLQSPTTMGARHALANRLELCLHRRQCTNRKCQAIAMVGRFPAWCHPLLCDSCPATAAARECPTWRTSGRWRRNWRGIRGLAATAVSRTRPLEAAIRAGGVTTMVVPRVTTAAPSRLHHLAPVRRRQMEQYATRARTRLDASRSRRLHSTPQVAGWTAFVASGRHPNAKAEGYRRRSTGAEAGWPE